MAKDFAEKYLGPDDDVTVNFTERYNKALQEITPKLNKTKELEERKQKNKQARNISGNQQRRRNIQSNANPNMLRKSVRASPYKQRQGQRFLSGDGGIP